MMHWLSTIKFDACDKYKKEITLPHHLFQILSMRFIHDSDHQAILDGGHAIHDRHQQAILDSYHAIHNSDQQAIIDSDHAICS